MKLKSLAPLVVAAAALFSACGDSSTASTSSVVNLDGTAYATLPPTESSAPVGSTPAEGDVSAAAQDYTILPEDTSRIKVAEKFGVTVEALDQANVATAGYGAFYPGLTIKIPAGATVPGAATTPTTTAVATGASVAPSATTTTVASNTDGCTTGSYTILADDTTRTKVAAKFDITVEQLDAANANTSGYSAFYPGLKIIIPCP